MIYEVQITKENVRELIYKEMCRVAMDYGGSPQEVLAAMVLPPSAYKLLEIALSTFQRMPELRSNGSHLKFEGIDIYVGATPVILPVYDARFWYCAHQDSKKMVDEIGGLDC
ncbi:hypothetical protein UFOVP1365_50 [uncultured Caudovirales phage]|uniref:Uncharacterized protein n=1 Tax=uncultured Caudovirales phage TaxID=2100421 RepID=A0A6J5S046_9CAUD|nr:hypothetical protein UFOVP1365_50 [uncultured Caudovirales phage]